MDRVNRRQTNGHGTYTDTDKRIWQTDIQTNGHGMHTNGQTQLYRHKLKWQTDKHTKTKEMSNRHRQTDMAKRETDEQI
jgi:hypothetical protein